MADMPIEPRLAKCLLASVSEANCNADVNQQELIQLGSNKSSSSTDHKDSGMKREGEGGCTEEMLSIAAMCSVDYPFISLKARASDERKQQRLGQFSGFAPLCTALHCTALLLYMMYTLISLPFGIVCE